MAQYEMKDGKRVLVSRTQPAPAQRTAPSMPASSQDTQAKQPAKDQGSTKSQAKTGAKTPSKED